MSAVPEHMDREHRRSLQMALNELTKSFLKVDGDFGPKSVAVLKKYQEQTGLQPTGVYDAPTQAKLEPFIAMKYLNEADYNRAAKSLAVNAASVKTVVEVEAGGDGFLPSGDCDILFERHKFYSALSKKRPKAEVDALMAKYPNIVNTARGGYLGGQKEWDRINQAAEIDRNAAYLSASWGMFQIMGFNHKTCGYATVEAMVADMKQSEGKQLDAFVNFVTADARLHKALIVRDWASFALYYNGPAYKENKYDVKLAAAYKQFSA